MATWKKLLVSGSAISQLNNDAGYLTSATAFNAFVTASVNGVPLIADSTTDTLSFVTGSAGAGLTIVGTSGTDTITFDLSSIPNTSLANDGITIAGNDISLGGSISAATIFTGTNVVSMSLDADLATFSLPASTTISSFGASLIDDADAAAARTTLGVDAAGTDNSTDVTLDTSSHNYLSLSGQEITLGQIDISDDTNFAVSDTSGQTGIDLTLTGDTLSGTLVGLGTGASPQFTNLTLSGNLTVQGDTINANVTNLDIEDRYILLNSGSSTIGDSGIVFGGSNGVAQSGAALIWDASHNGNDGRAAVVNNMASNATGDQTPNYHLVGAFSGSAANAATAQADHLGNIRVLGGEIFIYV